MDAILERYEARVATVEEDLAEADEVTKEQLACFGEATSDCEQRKGVGSGVMWVFGIALTVVLAKAI